MEKIISEQVEIIDGTNLDFKSITQHLSDGWTIVHLFHQPIYVNKTGPTSIILTAHLQKVG